ncbi:tRNA (N6-isopentenyl adenosine(37)-C2)-methylthiotransferase MiaB [Candidatus Omnitrophota bacterium]
MPNKTKTYDQRESRLAPRCLLSWRSAPRRAEPRDKNSGSKVFIRTFGCQMNVRDSEVVAGLLKKEGYRLVDKPEGADIILLNTCSVRQHAEDKVWSEIGRYKVKGPSLSLRTDYAQKKIIGVIGCMAQNYKEDIFRRAPNVRLVIGPSDIDKIPQALKKVQRAACSVQRKELETGGELRPEAIYHSGFHKDKKHSFVVISEGCSNFCSYCVVPHVRGELHNRSAKDVLKEIEEAVDKGIENVTLLGQNVNAYNDEEVDFVRLLGLVNQIKGLKEFSFITSHPKDVDSGLFEAMQDLDKLRKYLHLPVQSGSDRILKLMNRGYTRKIYLDLAADYRRIVKGGILTTDVIVGFPGEREADFQDTYDLVKEIKFNAAYIFKYSTRPHTKASEMIDDVPRQEKERRHALILELQKKISSIKKC